MKKPVPAGFPVLATLFATALILGGALPAFAQSVKAAAVTAVQKEIIPPPASMMTATKIQAPATAPAEVHSQVQVQTKTAPVATKTMPETAPQAQKKPAQGLMPTTSTNTNIVSYGGEKPTGDDTHPILNLTLDKSELVRLESDASSVVVGNPDHLGVLMDNRRLLILIPRLPGATYLSVLDAKGAVIMQRHVIVGSPKSDYVRIRRSCAGQPAGCQETSVYFCPGMCHPVGIVATQDPGNIAPVPSTVATATAATNTADQQPDTAPEAPVGDPAPELDVNPVDEGDSSE